MLPLVVQRGHVELGPPRARLCSTAAVVVAGVKRLAGERRGGATALAAPGLAALVERERTDAERHGGIGPPQAEGTGGAPSTGMSACITSACGPKRDRLREQAVMRFSGSTASQARVIGVYAPYEIFRGGSG